MIVPMKRVSLLTLADDRNGTLEKVRNLGVMHVAYNPGAPSEGGESLREQKATLERVISLIPPVEKGDSGPKTAAPREVSESARGDAAVDAALIVAEGVVERAERRTQLQEERERITRELERLAPWGSVDPEKIRALKDAGISLVLLEGTAEQLVGAGDHLPHQFVISRNKSLTRIAGVSFGDVELPDSMPVVTLPDSSPADLQARQEEIAGELDDIDGWLREQRVHLPVLSAALEQLERDLEFSRVAATMEGSDHLAWLTGYLPHDGVAAVQDTAREHGWGLVIDDPRKDDPVPTLLRNPKPVGIIRPVFDLLGTVPGYRELDISFFFLLFFIVFFAMIIGDGGYGLVLLSGTVALAVRGARAGKPPGNGAVLMIVLSSATVIWGAITGNWFGYAPFAELPVLRSLVIPQISIDSDASTQLIQRLCFVIGTVHLSIAHIWKFLRGLREAPRVAAVAQLGWLAMVLGLYYLVLQLVVDPDLAMPAFALPLIGGGLAAVILFGAQEAGVSFIVGVGKGVAGIITTVLDSISAFSDIISYIRLFAVGLATLAIAEAFNSMAGGVAEGLGGVGGAVAAVLILFLGHTLNLAMGALSVVVHGVRLNMLEFSGHLGMEWTGVEYTPFES